MLELLRDPAWQFAGVLVALLTVMVMLLVYRLQRPKKALSYEVVSKNQLLTVKEELQGRLQVLYEGQPAKDICLLVIRFFNSGNIPITTADYERSVSFGTGASSKVLSVAITDVNPKNLVTNLTVEESRVTLQPVLMNSKDSITLKLLVKEFEGTVAVDGRVVGVRAISNAGQTPRYQAFILVLGVILTVLGVSFAVHFTPKPEVQPPLPIGASLGWAVATVGYLVTIATVTRNRAMRIAVNRALHRIVPRV